MWCSTRLIGDGGERSFTDSSDVWRERNGRFTPVRTPLLDSMNRDNLEGKALLLDHSIERGVVTIDGVLWNSGDALGLSGEGTEE
jgi:hypothetical protein